MNVAVNPLVSFLGGGATPSGEMLSQQNGISFSQIMQGQLSLDADAPPVVHHVDMARLVGKANALVTSVMALEVSDLDVSEISLEDLAGFFAGDMTIGDQITQDDGDLASLMQTLSDIQDLLRDLIDLLPDLIEQVAPEGLGAEDIEIFSFAAIVEVTVLLRDVVSNQQVMVPNPAIVGSDAKHLQVVGQGQRPGSLLANLDRQPIQSLSLMSDVDGIALPETQGRDALTLTPQAATVFRTIAVSVIQTQKVASPSIDFEASETPLALAARADQPAFEEIEAPQAPQPTPRPENQISTKFANVLVNQVRQVELQEGTTRIELSPRGLGSVEVEMRTNNDGSLSVVVRAENDAVLSALREERDLLAAIIGDGQSGSLDFQEYSQEQNNEPSQFGADGALIGEGDDIETEADAAVSQIVSGPQLDLVT